jgi:putative MATE family efflux protein
MKDLDLGKTKINKIFWVYVIPSIFSIIFSTTAQFIDSAFIGRYVGASGLASITMLIPFLMLLNGISIMIAIGGVTYAGISRGKGDYKKSNNFFNLTLFLILIAGIISTISFLIINHNFSTFFNVDQETLTQMQNYGFWICLFFVFGMMNLTCNLFLNLDRKPILVVIVSSSSTVLNIILNYVFMVTLQMGMTGAGLASGISQLIPTLIFAYIIIKKSSWHIRFPSIRIYDIGRILFNGSSELVSISSVAIASFILNKIILNTVGITGVAGFSIAMQLGGLVISFGFGVSDAIQSPVSFNYGAQLYDRVKQILKKGVLINVIFGFMLLIICNIFAKQLSSIFVTDSETIAYSVRILKYYSLAFIIMGANVVIATYYTSVDSPIISGIITLLKSLVYLLAWLTILPQTLGENGIWLALVFAEFSTIITVFFIYRKYPYGNATRKLDLQCSL